MKKIYYGIMVFIILSCIVGAYAMSLKKEKLLGLLPDKSGYVFIENDDARVSEFFIVTKEEALARSEYIQNYVKEALKKYLSQNPREITKEQALYALDAIGGLFGMVSAQLGLASMTHPDKDLVKIAYEEDEKLTKLSIDLFGMNRELYLFLKEYAEHGKDVDTLLPEERYDLEEGLKQFEKSGLNRDEATRAQITQLSKEISELCNKFELNIAQDGRTIEVSRDELAGVPEDFVATLQKNDQGLYILKMDYPTQQMVMENCSVAQTRQRFAFANGNKGYPQNEQLLKDIVKKRHELATILGYKTYADYSLSDAMAKSPERIWSLYREFDPLARRKAQKEFEVLASDLPEGVTLTSDGKINSWDLSYATNKFIKKHYAFNELELAEYFPFNETIQGLFGIYEQFFGIKLERIEVERKWHEDVFAVKVSKDGQLLGYVFLDMHPRENKYGHAAKFGGKNTHRLLNGTRYPGVCTLVCNFPKATPDKPALLPYSEVNTFFHEFGHALHSILSDTHLLSHAGTNTKRDFVELPSQLLEFWLEDKAILKSLGKHYKTGASIPDDLIERKLALSTFSNGLFECRQTYLAKLALRLYEKSEHNDVVNLYYSYARELLPFIHFDDNIQFVYNFGHLTGYGPQYYGYLWTCIFACDVFEQIEKEGLLNPAAGKRYLDCILSKGGSKDPNQLLFDYLGRVPTQQAFLKRNKFVD